MFLTMAMAMAVALAAQPTEARAPQRARANLSQYFSADDYPETALTRRAEGTTQFRLDIDAEGAVVRCSVTRTSGNAALDAATCSVLLGRARYLPARDRRGRPIDGRDEGRVTWRLPPLPPPGPSPLVLTRTLSRLHGDGNGLLTCTVLVDGDPVPNIGTSQCGALSGTGTDHALRSAPTSGDVVMVWVAGPTDSAVETPTPDEAALGTRAFNLAIAMDVGQDGRITACRVVGRDILSTMTFATTPDVCANYPPSAPPVFAPATGPRSAKMRLTMYLSGWALDVLSGSPVSARPPSP